MNIMSVPGTVQGHEPFMRFVSRFERKICSVRKCSPCVSARHFVRNVLTGILSTDWQSQRRNNAELYRTDRKGEKMSALLARMTSESMQKACTRRKQLNVTRVYYECKRIIRQVLI